MPLDDDDDDRHDAQVDQEPVCKDRELDAEQIRIREREDELDLIRWSGEGGQNADYRWYTGC